MCTCAHSHMQEFDAKYSAALKAYGQRVPQQKVPSHRPHSFRESARQATIEAGNKREDKKEEEEEAVSQSTESEEYLLAVAFDYEIVETNLNPLDAIAVSFPVSEAKTQVCHRCHSCTTSRHQFYLQDGPSS